jgi:gluconolactonase
MATTLALRKIATGVGYSEGPVIRADGEIIFVSIDPPCVYRIKDGKTEVFADVGGGPNGATEGIDGTIYITQSAGRWGKNPNPDWSLISGIQAIDRGGNVRWVSTDPISPNDLCFGPDGLLYVTDPTRYHDPRDDGRLFRINVTTGEAELLCTVPWYPNGIGFGLEDDALYVAKTGPDRGIMRLPLDNGRLGKAETFIQMEDDHGPDGFLFDAEGNLTTIAKPNRVDTYDRNGKLIDSFDGGPQKSITNVALSGHTLIITAAAEGEVLAVDNWPHAGLPLHPFRKPR